MSDEMEIMDYFVSSIQSGRYEPHDKLPSENEIADRMKVPVSRPARPIRDCRSWNISTLYRAKAALSGTGISRFHWYLTRIKASARK